MDDRAETCWQYAENTGGAQSALWAIASALFDNASAIRYAARHLGLNDAATPMGAMEALGKSVTDAADRIAMSLDRS